MTLNEVELEVDNKLNIIEFTNKLKEEGAYIGQDNHLYTKKNSPLSRMCSNGYYLTRKMYNSITHHFMEHRIIWVWHNGTIDDSLVINHLDYNRSNNDISNLEMVTHKQNMQHSLERVRAGTRRGADSPRAKLTEMDVMLIHHLNTNGFSKKEIHTLFPNVWQNTIGRVLNGTRYGNVTRVSEITAVYPLLVEKMRNRNLTKIEELTNYTLGLAGETGEVADIIKKNVFHGHELNTNELTKELGDVLFYLVAIANVLDLDLTEIMLNNIAKLEERYPNGFSQEDSLNRKEYNEKYFRLASNENNTEQK